MGKILDITINEFENLQDLMDAVTENGHELNIYNTKKDAMFKFKKNGSVNTSERFFYWCKELFKNKEYFILHEILLD